jgi:hypothetical protein
MSGFIDVAGSTYRERGAYDLVATTGTMAAGIAAASPIFSFRWATEVPNAKALIDRVTVSVTSLTTGFTPGVGYIDAVVARGFSSTDYGGVAAPAMTSAVASESGGTLPAGSYYYKVTAIGPWGESAASTESSAATIAGATGSVTVTYGAVAGATGYRVYRGAATGAQNVWYSDAASTFVDTGATPDGTGAPSTDPTVGGATLTGNNCKRATGMDSTLLTSARISSTSALVAGTRTLDSQAFGAVQFAIDNGTNTVSLPTRDGDLWVAIPECHPPMLAAQEGFVVRVTVPATGTWRGIVHVEWREVLG